MNHFLMQFPPASYHCYLLTSRHIPQQLILYINQSVLFVMRRSKLHTAESHSSRHVTLTFLDNKRTCITSDFPVSKDIYIRT